MNTVIFSKNKTAYTVIVPANPAPVEETAAQELKDYFKKVFGADVPVCKEGSASGKCIYVGWTAFAEEAGIKGKSTENWIIKMHDGNLVLTGGVERNDRGIIYAVYHFLEDVVGVRWWSNWEEYIPEISELELPADFCKEGTPALVYRKILGYRDIKDFSYEARTRANVVGDDGLENGAYNPSVEAYGGALQMGRPHHVHTLNKYFPAADFFEEKPDWFAWSDVEGRRVPYAHYCLSNDELVEACINKVLSYIEEDKKLEEETGVPIPHFYDISFPDSMGALCQCEKCKAAIEKSGNTGYALQFMNKIARVVAEKHPDVMLETLAYAVYLEPPKDDTLPEKNVIIRLAQVYVDIIHDIEDRGNVWYKRLLKSWSDICKKAGCPFYIWEYMYNLFLDTPLPAFGRLANTFKSFYEHGVTGIFVENERLSTDMWELQHYMMLHLAEDPYLDGEELFNDFVTKFFGPAAEYMRDYLNELRRSAKDHDFSSFCIIESHHFTYLDAKAVKRGMELLAKAREAVKGDPVFEFRVQYEQTLLGTALLVKYFDLKKMAARDGEEFEYDREAIRKMVVEGFEAAKSHPRFTASQGSLKQQIEYYSNLVIGDENWAPLPEELSGVNPDDVYQYFYKDSSRFMNLKSLYGVSYVEDPESCLGRVQKMCREDPCDPLEMSALLTTSRDAEFKSGVQIYIQQDGEYKDGIELFKEDIVADQYHLYKVGSVSGIQSHGDTRVDIFGVNFDWLSLSGISVAFPMDACDVYLSIKFAGELYGGSPDVQEAVYLDRAIVVRKG